MAELELRAVVCTRRLSNEKNVNSEKNLQLELTKLKDKVSKKGLNCKTSDPIMFLGEKMFGKDSSGVEAPSSTTGHQHFETLTSKDNGNDGDRKKRCCDRYDSSESSDSGVVVLSSTDCSSSSSACSGHSDITSEPGSPYSSPVSAALGSPSSPSAEESEDSTPASLSEPPLPDPPDLSWYENKKRLLPFNNTTTSTPKRFKSDSGNTTINNNTSLIPYPPVNLNNSHHQKSPFQKIDSKIELPIKSPCVQQKWPLPKNNLGNDGIKGQGKITEYFKTQIKSTLATQKSPLLKKVPVKSVKKDGIDKFLRVSTKEDEEETTCRLVTTEVKSTTDLVQPLRLEIRETTVVEEILVIDTDKQTHNDNKTESALVAAAPKSPILSAPRVIRFPVAKQSGSLDSTNLQTIRCCWSECELDFNCTSKLLEHLQSVHVNSQMRGEQFVCLWVGCKVHSRPSCSLTWLERHVLSHGGSKPFRCIVDGCGQRFSSQVSLERHVNSHFNVPANMNGNGNSSNAARRSTDAAPNKLFRRNGKKLRYRRQPWSARMFDYIDTGMMEGLTYRLLTFTKQQFSNVTSHEQEQEISQGNNLALRSKIMASRVETDGTTKYLVHWSPEDILPDEWITESEFQPSKVVPLSSLTPDAASTLHDSLLPQHSKATRKPRKPRSCSPPKRLS